MVKRFRKLSPMQWRDSYGYPNIPKQAPRITKQVAKIKVVLLGESSRPSVSQVASKLRKILMSAKKSGNKRKVTAIKKVMRQRASFLRSMFRD